MSEGIPMRDCLRCHHVHFPPRPVCPRCHGTEFGTVHAVHGLVEELTEVREARIGSVRSEAGPLVVAALPADVEPGARVRLSTGPGGAYVPAGVA
ncbi:zinc ribbon domain-containing protein [Sciscionella sediminilitoris]|uniref:zinc ribbon domain-containing protein n=1 Tax=Sciscionella sediminilitoris TaxID=1445613 RepID=UPI0004DF2938|nr:zinc ribbon domain-containing protein [Sciscionella sp. SE31]